MVVLLYTHTCDLITIFSGRKEHDSGTRLGKLTRKKRGQTDKERSTKYKIATINDDKIHFSDILIAQSLN